MLPVSPALAQIAPAPTSDPAVVPPPVEKPAGKKGVYLPADFARFAPRTAYDMLANVPGFTIKLERGGKRVTTLRPGTYALVVSDKSPVHDFHISGPGLSKIVTGVSFVGSKTIRVKLKPGTYRYVCDPHRTLMHGRFRVS